MAQTPHLIKDTRTTTSRILMPQDTNPQGNAYGGSIMKYLDEIAAVVARRHARANVVTASIERMDFLAPVYLGDLLVFKCALIYTGKTSMIVGCKIEAEDMSSGRIVKTGSCYLTFVALDRDGRPTPVEPVKPSDDEEKRWYAKGRILREQSKALATKFKEHDDSVTPA
jgi:acyl-CoA hydrolase